jgi:flagellar motor switch/type III secretory pathway protein FliN
MAADWQTWLRSGDTACELVRLPQDGAHHLCLLIPSSDAASWVDRVLGGDGRIGHAQRLGEAELGVLAYALGRGLKELAPDFQLARIETARREGPPGPLEGGMIWPLALRTPGGTVDLRVLFSEAAGADLRLAGELLVTVSDESGRKLSELEPGDLLLSDRIPLTVTASGLVGNVEIRVLGSREVLPARLDGRALCVRPRSPDSSANPPAATLPSDPTRVEFVLARQALSFAQHAHLTGGDVLSLKAEVPMDPVLIMQDGIELGEGALVVHRGELGVRVGHLY